MNIQSLTEEIVSFRNERDWEQFHTPRNLAAALAIESAELQQEMLWMTDKEIADMVGVDPGFGRVSDELADVLIMALLFAHATGIDVQAAVRTKLQKNEEKYPVHLSKGSAKKYTDL